MRTPALARLLVIGLGEAVSGVPVLVESLHGITGGGDADLDWLLVDGLGE